MHQPVSPVSHPWKPTHPGSPVSQPSQSSQYINQSTQSLSPVSPVSHAFDDVVDFDYDGCLFSSLNAPATPSDSLIRRECDQKRWHLWPRARNLMRPGCK
eukprot:2244048-Pyramimonas_sp.AAC.1